MIKRILYIALPLLLFASYAQAERPVTANFTSAMIKTSLKPVTLVELTFSNTSTAYAADYDYTADGQAYEGILSRFSEVRDLNDSDFLYGIPVPAMDIEFINISTAALNGPLSRKFDSLDAKKTRVKVYQWFDGESLVTADKLLIFNGYIQSYDYNELTIKCLVANELWRENSEVGTKITLDTYTSAAPKDVGQSTNIIYGTCKNVLCQNIVAGGADILKTDISDTATSIVVSKLPNAKRFPTNRSFTIKIHNEEIRCSAYNDSTGTITVTTRGYNSTQASEHNAGRVIWEVLPTYDYLVADHAVKAINDIWINGSRLVSGATKVLTPKAMVKISPDYVLDTSSDLDSFNDSLIHGDSKKTIRVYASVSRGSSGANANCDVSPTVPDLGPVSEINAYVRLYNHGAAGTVDITDGSAGFTISFLNLAMQAGVNTYILPASSVTSSMTWNTLRLDVDPDGTNTITVMECSFEVTYESAGIPPIKTKRLSAEIGGAGGVLNVATDAETLGTIFNYSVEVTIRNTSGSDVTNAELDGTDNYTQNNSDLTIPANTTMTFEAGPYDTFVNTLTWNTLYFQCSGTTTNLVAEEVTFVIQYQDDDAYKPTSVSADGLTAAAIEIGSRVTVDCDGYADDGSGTWTGTASALIENPADVGRHFIHTYSNLTTNFSNFSSARVSCDSASYVFAGVIRSHDKFVNILQEMAFESRMKIWDDNTNVRAFYMPATYTATEPVIKTQIAQGISILSPRQEELINTIYAHYNRDNGSRLQFSGFYSLYNVTDATSITTYGTRERPDLFNFEFIVDQTTAESVADYYLSIFKDESRYVRATLFLDNINLEDYDVITMTDNATAINLSSKKLIVVPPIGIVPGYRERVRNDRGIIRMRTQGNRIDFLMREVP